MSTIKVTNLKHESSASDNIALDSSGRVGVGTSSPDQTLSVGSGAADTRMSINGTGQYQLKFTNSGANGFWIGSPSANSLAFAQDDGATRMTIDSSGNLKFNSGYGSVATAYGVRAWVNFDGTGTAAIKEDGGISSFTDVDTGKYRIGFATTMPDTNYCPIMGICNDSFAGTILSLGQDGATGSLYSKTTSQLQFRASKNGGDFGVVDVNEISLAIIR